MTYNQDDPENDTTAFEVIDEDGVESTDTVYTADQDVADIDDASDDGNYYSDAGYSDGGSDDTLSADGDYEEDGLAQPEAAGKSAKSKLINYAIMGVGGIIGLVVILSILGGGGETPPAEAPPADQLAGAPPAPGTGGPVDPAQQVPAPDGQAPIDPATGQPVAGAAVAPGAFEASPDQLSGNNPALPMPNDAGTPPMGAPLPVPGQVDPVTGEPVAGAAAIGSPDTAMVAPPQEMAPEQPAPTPPEAVEPEPTAPTAPPPGVEAAPLAPTAVVPGPDAAPSPLDNAGTLPGSAVDTQMTAALEAMTTSLEQINTRLGAMEKRLDSQSDTQAKLADDINALQKAAKTAASAPAPKAEPKAEPKEEPKLEEVDSQDDEPVKAEATEEKPAAKKSETKSSSASKSSKKKSLAPEDRAYVPPPIKPQATAPAQAPAAAANSGGNSGVTMTTPTPQAPPVQTLGAGSWQLRGTSQGKAWFSKAGSQELVVVTVGDTVPGIGKISSIEFEGGRWVVRGSQGTAAQ
jgi:hypothetical protein